LDSKTEEVAQLRRQLDAQDDADVGTLSEQLREARRESQMWKERAEAAERRVKVFEKFTANLRGIREAAAVADEGDPSQGISDNSLDETQRENSASSKDALSPGQHMEGKNERRLVGHTTRADTTTDDSGNTEDIGTVTARIRRCLHSNRGPAERDSSDTGSVINVGKAPADLDGVDSPGESIIDDTGIIGIDILEGADGVVQVEEGPDH
jgi:hypothetical protein